MALSAKVASLTCLGFIFGMSWLVSLVARPIVEMPTPLAVRGPDAGGGVVLVADTDSGVATRSVPLVLAGRFACSSPVEVERNRNHPDADAPMVAEALPENMDVDDAPLPPLNVPEAPVIAAADEAGHEPEASLGAGNSVMTITSIPEAIITDTPAHGARLLAALVAGTESSETTARRQARASTGPAAPVSRKYKVRRGDTLVKIMRREWKSDDAELMDVLLAANPRVAKRRDRIFAGEVLNIPVLELAERGPAVGCRGSSWEPGRSGRLGDPARTASVRWYTIRERDSLASIARLLLNDEARWREIAQLNEMRNADKILPGTRIKLPPRVGTDT